MHVKYFVQTVYEGHCPICGDYRNGSFPEWVDKICDECRCNEILKAIINKKVNISEVTGGSIEGYKFHIKAGGKQYIIESKYFYEVGGK